ncbi:1-deoxy-D-xylulose-5-phosphate reductoisomerase [Aestuariibacter salexigens]|uniref:1-deoxy-D-xylulose-5-phosphate reductoisomerase n=1 Tax=Aestuariibacter salexigens TaxID=226010 RepID=UPI0003FD3D37|nr:1-deoxy-D-xylulose-5-phosphate reductoisomerase [Aestuariibacter salexigens]
MQTITVLGATGSIGLSTLDVVNRHPDRYRVFALTGNQQYKQLIDLAKQCAARYVVIADESYYPQAIEYAGEVSLGADVLTGSLALQQVASAAEVDCVMAAIVGAAGLLPTLAAVKAGKRVLLANKESLVMSGELFMQAVIDHNATLLPIDSEHNAIFQCLPQDFTRAQLTDSGISNILLTGSGGPFLHIQESELVSVTPQQACAHPNWEMGRKISVDSATMMNKGLEFIEACWLFGLQADDIKVVLHPQSVIHSMVQYIDGSVIAQMGNPDMRTPIAYGLAYPHRIHAGVDALDFSSISAFTFDKPCPQRYPNLYLAIDAFKHGQYATTALNAANEVAVDAFLAEQIKFTDIASINESVLNSIEPVQLTSIQDVIEFDAQARSVARRILTGIMA